MTEQAEITKAEFIAKPAQLTPGPYTGAAMGTFDPGALAEEALGHINYGELMAYCYRRFGPPNSQSDSYKELANWTITTPMDGVFLGVSIKPHETSLLFCYRISRQLDLGVSSVTYRREHEERERWRKWCLENKGEEPPLWTASRAGIRYGTPEYAESNRKQESYRAEFENSAEAKADFETDISLFSQANDALKAAINDLKRPVFVRDVAINACGVCEDDDGMESVDPFCEESAQ